MKLCRKNAEKTMRRLLEERHPDFDVWVLITANSTTGQARCSYHFEIHQADLPQDEIQKLAAKLMHYMATEFETRGASMLESRVVDGKETIQ